MTALFQRAISRLGFPLIVLQWAGNLLALLLAAAWLQIPDSHAWQFAFSMLSGGALAIGFCWLQVVTFSRTRLSTTPATIWLRIVGFVLVAALWFLLAQWISACIQAIPDYAYLWNSKLSPGIRITFSPAHLIVGLTILLNVLIWALTALLLPIAIALSTDGLRQPSWKDARRPYRRILYWFAVFVFSILSTQLSSALVSWKPGKTVSGEVISVVVRLAIVWTTDILLWCLLLVFTAAWMEREPAAVIEIPAPS
jgi:hypothetical protein